MKKTIYAFAVISSMFLVSCGSDSAEDASGEGTEQSKEDGKEDEASGPSIVGDWKLTDLDMGMEIPEEQKAMFEGIIQEMKDNTLYSFTADGKIIMNTFVMNEKMTQEGTYSLDGEKLTVTMDGQAKEQNIKLTENSLTFSEEDRGTTMTMTFNRK
ncbi:lipocalin family protein [Crocinitomicaceae bacterium]|nr:lipocalin family protein [Crocinitomicaceae bacterium]MDB3907750.1 lipocalin family protein [Crocinitomicaceae bacterium]